MKILSQDYTLVTLDFETYYGPKYSLSLQTMNTYKYIADDEFQIHGVGVKIDDGDTTYFDFSDANSAAMFRELLDDLRDNPVALLCHNTAFDAFILHYHYDWHPALYLDTLSMSRGMFVGRRAGLKDLAIRLFPNEPSLRKKDDLEKTYGLKVIPESIAEDFANYCIRDVELTKLCFDVMAPHYPDDELRLIDWTLRANCEPWFEVDVDLVEDEINYQVETRQSAITASGISEGTLKSDKQFLQFLHSKGVEPEYKRNAKDTEDIPALGQKDWGYQRMVARHPELGPVWGARRLAKSNIQESRARWFKAVAEWNGGKMPVPLNYYGADTGRWSGGEKLNLQNLPRNNNGETITDPNSGRLRRSLLAPDGSHVVVRDLSNIEGRMLAWEADQAYLLDLFRTGGCPYLYLAESIYGAAHGTFSKSTHAGERNVGKIACLGLGYGMGVNKFWITMNTGPMGMDPITTSIEEASQIVNIYRNTNDRIKHYWDMCGHMIERMAALQPGETYEFGPLTLAKEMAILPNGMALQYPDLTGIPNQWGGYDFRFGENKKIYGGLFCENITQALARVVLGEQLLSIQRELDDNYGRDTARVVHSVHDELIVICPEDKSQEVYDMMGDVMSTSPSWAPTLPLKSEGGIAREYSK